MFFSLCLVYAKTMDAKALVDKAALPNKSKRELQRELPVDTSKSSDAAPCESPDTSIDDNNMPKKSSWWSYLYSYIYFL